MNRILGLILLASLLSLGLNTKGYAQEEDDDRVFTRHNRIVGTRSYYSGPSLNLSQSTLILIGSSFVAFVGQHFYWKFKLKQTTSLNLAQSRSQNEAITRPLRVDLQRLETENAALRTQLRERIGSSSLLEERLKVQETAAQRPIPYSAMRKVIDAELFTRPTTEKQAIALITSVFEQAVRACGRVCELPLR